MRIAPLVVVLLLAVMGVGGVTTWRSLRSAPPVTVATVAPPLEPPPRGPSWCDSSLEPLDGEGCFASPGASAAPQRGAGSDAEVPLVLYLHGMYERTLGRAEELDRQRRVAARATAKGFAVLALRGREGECNARPELATWYCWPSNERTAGDGAAFVAAWKPALDAAEARVGPRGKHYVLGFSNGAYFAGLIAVRALFAADAVAVAHGGPVQPVKGLGRKPPLFLLSADDDESQDGMIYLDALLAQDGWPHDTYARSGGHALTDADIDAALTFFTRSVKERLPLAPPITEHRARLHARDAQVPGDAGEQGEGEGERAAPAETAPADDDADRDAPSP